MIIGKGNIAKVLPERNDLTFLLQGLVIVLVKMKMSIKESGIYLK